MNSLRDICKLCSFSAFHQQTCPSVCHSLPLYYTRGRTKKWGSRKNLSFFSPLSSPITGFAVFFIFIIYISVMSVQLAPGPYGSRPNRSCPTDRNTHAKDRQQRSTQLNMGDSLAIHQQFNISFIYIHIVYFLPKVKAVPRRDGL